MIFLNQESEIVVSFNSFLFLSFSLKLLEAWRPDLMNLDIWTVVINELGKKKRKTLFIGFWNGVSLTFLKQKVLKNNMGKTVN